MHHPLLKTYFLLLLILLSLTLTVIPRILFLILLEFVRFPLSDNALIKFLLIISDKSMNSNLCDFFTLADDLPSQSAMCQRRNLLFPDALRRILRLFTDNMTNLKTFNGYYLLACDGSDINIPYNPDDMETFHPGKDDNRGYNQLHLNALYDACNHIYQDIQIDTHT